MSRRADPDWIEIAQLLCVRAGMIMEDVAGECVLTLGRAELPSKTRAFSDHVSDAETLLRAAAILACDE